MSYLVESATLKAQVSQPINQRGRHGPYYLPANWRAIEGNPGELLYIQRSCGQYCCMPEHGGWAAYHCPMGGTPFTGQRIGWDRLREGAMILCRDDMHERQQREVA
jgi:hypothetical protein